jgi:hypothetical protein
MPSPGPLLETLLHRLAECPGDFLAEPRIGKAGTVEVAAVVNDLLHDLGGPMLTPAQAAVFQPKDAKKHRNWLRLVLVTTWLMDAPEFCEPQRFGPRVVDFLTTHVLQMAAHTSAEHFVTDGDRREELARWCLQAFDLRPRGESDEQAQDRLATLNTAERQRVIAAAQAAEQRARDIREAAARKAAEEAANLYSRE